MQRTLIQPVLLLILALWPDFAHADGKVVLKAKLKPAGTMRAVSEELKGEIQKTAEGIAAGRLTVKIESFDTDIGFRNDNFRKFLNSSKYPFATVTTLKGSGGKAKAELEVNGIKKPIEVEYDDSGSQWSGKFTVKLKDYNLEPASYLGISTADEVRVEVLMPEPLAEEEDPDADKK